MRWIAQPELERYEADVLPSWFAKTYEPHGSVSLRPDAAVTAAGTELLELDGEQLAIHPDSAAWAFVDEREAALLQATHAGRNGGATVADLVAQWSGAPDAIAAMWRRGLVAIDGRRAVDERMFTDSANYVEGHLVELLITEKCNLACGYCLAGANPSMPSMTPEIARRTIDLAFAMEEAGTIGFEFAGGEPFLKFKLLRELVDYIERHPGAAGRQVFVNVQTNATLLDDEKVRWAAEHGVRVGVSIDGPRPAQDMSRPTIHGHGSYDQLIAGIDALQRHGVPFGGLVVLNRSNVGDVDGLIDFLIDNEILHFRMNPVVYLGTARERWHELGLEQHEVIDFFQAFLERVVARGLPLLESNVAAMCDFLTSKQRKTRCMRSHCGAGDTFQSVAANGDIYPCGRSTQTPDWRLGNVLDDSVESLSAAGRHHPVLVQIRGRRPTSLDGCATCPYRELCQAGCSATAYERYGTVRHRTPECAFYKTMYPHLMRRLTFDSAALAVLGANGYFPAGAVIVDTQLLSAGVA
jgi:radical SAM protein with 4Fe4S-binding SPASM domain